jgi:hypothetical protein
MSVLPIETINAYIANLDMVIEIYGVPCMIFIPKNIDAREKLSLYQEGVSPQFDDGVETKVWIEWNPDMKKLRNMGIHVEGELPILAFFRRDHDVQRNSYFKLLLSFGTGANQEEEFELVDCVLKKVYNSSVVEAWKIVPRRA